MDTQQAFELLRDWAPLFIALLAPNVIQILGYLRIRRMWSALPVVIGTITRSKLLDYHDEDGKRVYEADIRVRYVFHGQEFEAQTAVLRSYRLFPQWHFESQLAARYRVGDVVSARVPPSGPASAYLEIAPFGWASACCMPFVTLWAAALALVWPYLKQGSS